MGAGEGEKDLMQAEANGMSFRTFRVRQSQVFGSYKKLLSQTTSMQLASTRIGPRAAKLTRLPRDTRPEAYSGSIEQDDTMIIVTEISCARTKK